MSIKIEHRVEELCYIRLTMRNGICPLRVIVLLTCPMIVAAAQEPFAIQPISAKAAADLPSKFVSFVQSEGIRVTTFTNGLQSTVADVFAAKSLLIHSNDTHAQGLLYPMLTTGEMLGIIRYPADSSQDYREDFRDQKLRAGWYTMRYVRLPADKQHHGVAVYRDFILLSPLSSDRSPGAALNNESLLNFGRLASHTKHPAILSLVPVDETQQQTSSLRPDDAGRWILQVNLHGRLEGSAAIAEQLSFAFIVATPIAENGGS